ncbi:hypothetical protein IFM89_002262 [Coptis chinensis]|uniref:EGF-like domain-containing protein n=1 Tax=Coptis chinensis TaxID=261450 RepID=A0A835ILB1_9MAGN|nr:hypothetical protein IFM89_002262 [Coptis chinensis]
MSSVIITILSFSVLLQLTTSADILAPILSPFIDKVCKEVLCGKGKCKVSTNFSLGYMCECDQGWKQTTADAQKHFKFLPCVIPNCTLDYSCTKAPSPSPQIKDPPKNSSFLDPCNWAYCGEGSCKKSDTFGYKCECQEGYANLLNDTALPCFSQCSLGMDCASLGITVQNKTASPNGASANHAYSLLPGKILWLTVLMIPTAMIPWK